MKNMLKKWKLPLGKDSLIHNPAKWFSMHMLAVLAVLLVGVLTLSGCGQPEDDIRNKEVYEEEQFALSEEELAELEGESVDDEMSALSDEEMEELGSAVVWAADLDEDSLVELSDEEKDVLIDEMDAVATFPDEEDELTVEEDGEYTSKDEVALYLYEFGHLPSNFITKNEAKKLGWESSKGNLDEVAPGKSIGGDRFGNYEGILPVKDGRTYKECDINYEGGYRQAERIIYSNDGLIFYTNDHYETFELLYGSTEEWQQ